MHIIRFEDLPLRISGVEIGGTCLIGEADVNSHGVQAIRLCPASANEVYDIEIGRGHRMFKDLCESVSHHMADEIDELFGDDLETYQSYADEHRQRVHEVL